MSKQLSYKILGILLFVASGIITIMYTISNVMGVIPVIVALIQGLGIESAKSFFSYTAVTLPKEQIGKKTMFGLLAVTALVISIVATTGFSINMSNKVKNYVMKKSDDYQNKQNFIKNQGDLYATTKQSIADLKTTRDKQIKGMEATRDAWGKNYKSAKSLEQDKINAAADKFKNDIAAKEAELSKTSESLNQKSGETVGTEGYEALYSTLAKFVNESKQDTTTPKPTTGDDVSFWMNFFVSVALEFFGIGFLVLAGHENAPLTHRDTKTSKTDNSSIGFKPTLVTANTTPQDTIQSNDNYIDDTKPSRIIGFQAPGTSTPHSPLKNESMETPKHYDTTNVQGDSGIDTKDLKVYLNFMYQNAKDNVSTGYMTISKKTGLTIENCRKIRGFLERHGVIATEGTKTLIKKQGWTI